MWFMIGLIRSTIFYSFIASALSGAPSIKTGLFYCFCVLVNALIHKKSNDCPNIGEFLAYVLAHDISAPFLGIGVLFSILSKRYLTNKNEPHAALFMSQGFIESIWSVLLLIFMVSRII